MIPANIILYAFRTILMEIHNRRPYARKLPTRLHHLVSVDSIYYNQIGTKGAGRLDFKLFMPRSYSVMNSHLDFSMRHSPWNNDFGTDHETLIRYPAIWRIKDTILRYSMDNRRQEST